MKRNAEKQITKDTAEEVDADAPAREGFSKAAPEVLRTRRILKVRRTAPAAAPTAPTAPSPFAALASANGRANGAKDADAKDADAKAVCRDAEKKKDAAPEPQKSPVKEKIAESTAENAGEEKTVEKSDTPEKAGEHAAAEVAKKEEAKTDDSEKNAVETNAPDTEKQNGVKKAEEEPKPEPVKADTPVKATGSGKKAKLDVSASTPEKKSDEKDGTKEAPVEKAADAAAKPADPESAAVAKPEDAAAKPVEAASATNGTSPTKRQPFVFGVSADVTSFADAAAKAGTSAGFTFSAAAAPLSDAAKETPRFVEQKVKTGEEHEEEKFRVRAKVYCLEEGSWRERGVGQLKLNVGDGRARLLMRNEATLRLALNAPLFNAFRLDRAADRAVRFHDVSHEKPRCFLVRFTTKADADGLVEAVDKCMPTLADAK